MVKEMDIPEGYKQTEVGVIPNEWAVDKIKNISSISTGAKNTHDKIDNGDYPFFVRSSIVERINSFSFNGEAILTAGDGVGTGKVFHYINGKFDFHQRVYKISDFNEKADGYFFYLFFANYFLKRIMAMTAKSSVDSVRMEMIAEMFIPIPPLQEQKAIAGVLSDVDALITSLEKLITKKRNIKQGAMQQLLTGKKRLPGFTEDWDVKKLDEIIRHTQLGGNYPNDEIETDFPLIKMGNIVRGSICFNKIEYISKGCVPNERDKLQYGDVLFNTRNTLELVGKVAIWKNELPLAYYNSNLLKLEFNPNEVADNFFLTYMFNSEYCLSQLKGFAIGTTSVAAIYTRDLLKLEIPLPPIPEQQAIAEILSDMDKEIEALEQKRDKYKAVKQGMMQELLTGKTRLI